MDPKAFLPADPSRPGAAAVVPATPQAAWQEPGPRKPIPRPTLTPAQFNAWAAKYLREHRNAPREYRLELINWRHQYQQQQEAAELQANPAAAKELQLIAARLARKAQSGFGGPSAGPGPAAAQ